MPKIVECVPNFSEGQNKEVIEGIAKAIASAPGCSLLDVDPGASTNRTVYTFVGSPEDVVRGAIAGALAASQLIDMSEHKGEHPRMGALDVCPFIPIQGVTMEDCVQCANQFAAGLAATLNVPVYLYGHASKEEYRRTVPQIRAGEYEGLQEKLTKDEWAPDYGPAHFIPQWGATITGARNFLIAYNVNILGTKEQAHRIALNIREQGRGKDQPGRLKNVQAIGWYLQEANMAQVSINIGDVSTTPMHVVYEECVKDAKELKLSVVGSEIVGLIPKSCMLEAAEYYMLRDGLFLLEEEHKIRLAVDRLGLHSIKFFDPKEKVIEYMLESDDSETILTSQTVSQFVRSVCSRTAVPGGGSVAALVGALGAGLGAMASLLTYGNKKFESLDSQMRNIIPPLHKISNQLIPSIDADSLAFNQFMEAAKMPAKTEEEIERKSEAKKEALYNAIAVPFQVAKDVNTLWDTLKEVSPLVNIQCLSDIQVCVRCLQTAVWGAYYNVKTNLKDLPEDEKSSMMAEIQAELDKMETESKSVLSLLDSREA